jgi:hypothetical protein
MVVFNHCLLHRTIFGDTQANAPTIFNQQTHNTSSISLEDVT